MQRDHRFDEEEDAILDQKNVAFRGLDGWDPVKINRVFQKIGTWNDIEELKASDSVVN